MKVETVMHSLLRSSPVNTILKTAARSVARSFESRDPVEAQREMLPWLIQRGAATQFGEEHGLTRLSGLPFERLYERYTQRVPIRTYQDFWRDYFFKNVQDVHGKTRIFLEDVTWPGQIPFFCETSGTTAPTKFIPFSQEMFGYNKKAAMEMVCCYLASNPKSRLFQGKLLYMAGNTNLSDMGNDIYSGDMSAITLRHTPWYLKPYIAPDPEVSALPWEKKLETLANILVADKNIRGISGVPPWILLLLKKCSELSGNGVRETLPNLELIIHGGTSMKPYSTEFDELFGTERPNYLEVLPSSEAFMGFQMLGERHMRLAPYYGCFFEFVPIEELRDGGTPPPNARAVHIGQVEEGKRYAIILTTCSGLWRYHIGDTIRFVSLSPLTIEFTGRDRFLDKFEEKVTQGEVEEAVARLNDVTGIEVKEFMVGPVIGERKHLWVLAMGDTSFRDSRKIGEILDHKLKELNADYDTFRGQGRIKDPAVLVVGEDIIYRWSKEVRGKLGGQSKIPHIDPTVDGELIQSLASFTSNS